MSSEENNKKTSGLTRREFIKDAGIVVGGASVASMALLSACKGDTKTVTQTVSTTVNKTVTKTVTVAEDGVELTDLHVILNGEPRVCHIEANWTLRDALKEGMGVISLKDMCNGCGACGSCSAIVDGRPILTCMALAVECDGAEIETAEHLGVINHPLVNAYAKNFCAQCGYCTPGFLITAKALLDKKPNPTDEDIIDALGGNICRCGTYPQHIIAIKEAAKGGK